MPSVGTGGLKRSSLLRSLRAIATHLGGGESSIILYGWPIDQKDVNLPVLDTTFLPAASRLISFSGRLTPGSQ